MTTKVKNISVVFLCAIFIFGFFAFCLLKPAKEMSESERRPLEQMPQIGIDSVVSGRFMQDFEKYTTYQFPFRDNLRTVKSLSAFYLFAQKDVNGIFMADGYASKLEYPNNINSLNHAAQRFENIYNKYLNGRDVNIYLSVIPDKNYFLAEKNGFPSLDYEAFVAYIRNKTEYMQYIDIFDCLTLKNYYKTDTHWKQEELSEVADRLAFAMGATLSQQYTVHKLEKPFYGVYYGQSALPLCAEDLHYLTSDVLDSCKVYDFETQSNISVYDMEKAFGKDPYEMFLSGSKSLIKIDNPNAQNDKKLIIFRDSFGSSIAPLLAAGYSRTILVDIRYISAEVLDKYIDFNNSDVLFLYSTLVLNNSISMK